MSEMKTRKSVEDVRAEGTVAKAKRKAAAEKAEAYQVQYKAAALARREKLASEGAAAPEVKS